jgi:Flp pilus assembly protein TadG
MPKHIRKSERGQSLSELALSFTFLLLLVGGIIELGSMFYTMVALRDSAQEGVLYASINPTDSAGVRDRVQASASFPLDSTQISSVTVLCNGVACFPSVQASCQGQKITVRIAYDYHPSTPLLPYPTMTLASSLTNTILQSDARETYITEHPGTPKCP